MLHMGGNAEHVACRHGNLLVGKSDACGAIYQVIQRVRPMDETCPGCASIRDASGAAVSVGRFLNGMGITYCGKTTTSSILNAVTPRTACGAPAGITTLSPA